MKNLPKKLQKKLDHRKTNNALRQLGVRNNLIDFSSNDYLGFSKSETIFSAAHQFLIQQNIIQNGSTGSRLLSGNHQLYNQVEKQLCTFHNSQAALIFNSGYDANMGFFSSVLQRGDIVFYDEYIHASIRDGLALSNAKTYKFKHNNLEDLEKKCETERSRKLSGKSPKDTNIYIVTESVFSMDGDSPDLKSLSILSKKLNAHIIVDEAHAIGVFGKNGSGLIQNLKLEKSVFARIVTFGKALGCHGAAVLGSSKLKAYLINFSRSFIYTTALPPHSLATIFSAYNALIISNDNKISELKNLHQNIQFFKSEIIKNKLQNSFIESHSAIQSFIVSGNENVKQIAKTLQEKGFDVKPILSPTVPKEQERLRFCLHAYNSKDDITNVLNILKNVVI